MYNWSKIPEFLADKARCKAEFRVDLSDIPLTHRRDRIEVTAGYNQVGDVDQAYVDGDIMSHLCSRAVETEPTSVVRWRLTRRTSAG